MIKKGKREINTPPSNFYRGLLVTATAMREWEKRIKEFDGIIGRKSATKALFMPYGYSCCLANKHSQSAGLGCRL